MTGNAFIQLGISLLLGLLVGLQRERTESSLAGIRTFPLIAVFGTLCAWLGGWAVAAGLLALAALLVIANLARVKANDIDPGLTTEVAVLLMFGVGAYVVIGQLAVAVALGGAVALLLQWKKPMHEFVAAIGETDIKAIMQFALVTLVVLPVLPNRGYGPYAVLNPFKIWLMVVLIVGMSLGGYVVYKLWGQRTGTWLSGLLGGLISSTATTVSCARQAQQDPHATDQAARVILIASATMYVRMLLAIGIVAAGSFAALAPPLAIMLGAATAIAAGCLWGRGSARNAPTHANPAQLRAGLVFGALYAVVILAVAAAKQHFGDNGMYAVAGLSGLEGVDAITLSTAQLVNASQLATAVAWRAMVIGALTNLIVKAGFVAVLGPRRLLGRIATPFVLTLLAGAALLWLWPG